MFTSIYELFISFFGNSLADYLYGGICSEDGQIIFEGSNMYNMYGLIAIGISLAVATTFYCFNHPSFSKKRHWFLMLLLVGVSNFFIGAGMTLRDLSSGDIGVCMIVRESGGISAMNCWMFGLANLFVSGFFFIIVTVLVYNLLIGRFAIHNTCNTPIPFHKNK
jgi:hypothetical protein